MVNQSQANTVMQCRDMLVEAVQEMCDGRDVQKFLTLIAEVTDRLIDVASEITGPINKSQMTREEKLERSVRLILSIEENPKFNPETIVLTDMSRKQLQQSLNQEREG